MFNKEKCKQCIYKGGAVDHPTDIFCNYAFIADQTCLHRVGKSIIDRRGENPDNCLLFKRRGGNDE